MVDANNGIISAMSEMGIDPSTLDEGSDLETEIESTDAAEEVKEEVDEAQPELEDDSEETVTPEEEENAAVTPESQEAPKEEPKLTLKEFQELEAKRLELEAKEKSFMEERTKMEKDFQEKYHEKVKTHDEMDAFFAHLADKDPELFDLLKGEFQEHQKQYSNPVMDKTRNEIAELRKELDSFKSKASDEVTRTKLEAEKNELKSTLGKEAEAAGLKIDWAKVEDVWADSKVDLKKAFYAEYGEALTKAAASKAKVEAVTKKVEARPTVSTAGSISRSNTTTTPNYKGMSTFDVLRQEAKRLTGKAI